MCEQNIKAVQFPKRYENTEHINICSSPQKTGHEIRAEKCCMQENYIIHMGEQHGAAHMHWN